MATRDKSVDAARQQVRRLAGPEKEMLVKARARARVGGYPCTIDVGDITIPNVCPILGIPLFRGTGKPQSGSPSLDKVNPLLGYVPGNVRVISFQANAKKSDMTIEQLERLLLYMKGGLP